MAKNIGTARSIINTIVTLYQFFNTSERARITALSSLIGVLSLYIYYLHKSVISGLKKENDEKIAKLQNENNEKAAKLQNENNKLLNDLKTENAVLKCDLKNKSSDLDKAKNDIKKLGETSEETQKKYKDQIVTMSEQITNFRKENDELKYENAGLYTSIRNCYRFLKYTKPEQISIDNAIEMLAPACKIEKEGENVTSSNNSLTQLNSI